MNGIVLRGKACQCTACGQVFTTESGFNRHRKGSYADGRTCLTVVELEAAGWTKRRGTHWMTPGPARPTAFPQTDMRVETNPEA